jgi:hypothetical protein
MARAAQGTAVETAMVFALACGRQVSEGGVVCTVLCSAVGGGRGPRRCGYMWQVPSAVQSGALT